MMDQKRNRWLLLAALGVVAQVASGCDIALPVTDCSWVNQPDMGGLLCLGANVLSLFGGAIAFLIALLGGLGGAAPV